MSVQNFRREQREGRRYTAKTATATLIADEVEFGFITATHSSSGIALTVPAASAALKGYQAIIADGGAAAVTVVVSAGYGGAGSGTDTVTLAQGDAVSIYCDGTSWYSISHTTGA